MLADFGTADVSPETMGEPISLKHFTTVENTPPDFLLLGSRARQDFKADSFALGLCWLHLLTGKAPYEELLDSVQCPKGLREALDGVWLADGDETYAPVRQLLESYDDDDEAAIIHTTLYRFLCLFGPPDEAAARDGDSTAAPVDSVCDGAAWLAVRQWLDSPGGRTRFGKDRAQWSVFSGKKFGETQKRMARLRGAEEMLRSLISFEPSRRWSAKRALRSDLFAPFRCEGGTTVQDATLRFLEYLHDTDTDME